MKKAGIVVSLLLGLGMLTATSCGKSSSSTPEPSVVENKIEIPKTETKVDTTANHNVKPINLRLADSFAVFAHESISSVPNSLITGKVGLRPGVRAMIGLTPAEVVGGSPEIFAADDKEIAALAFVTQAKVDVINAYNEAETSPADTDKINLFNGYLGQKVLAAGVYYWNSRVTIPLDLKLEGTDTDVFIFKVAGDLRVGTDVKVTMSGGALAKNVFWVVGDHVLIKANSAMVGTIMSQESFEMREFSTLSGRAFVKNSKLMLDKNTITLP